jgi:hypothetical protein
MFVLTTILITVAILSLLIQGLRYAGLASAVVLVYLFPLYTGFLMLVALGLFQFFRVK